MNKVFTALFSLVLITVCGCSVVENNHRQKEEMMTAYLSGNYSDALVLAEDDWDSASGTVDELVWCLEVGSLKFVNGDYEGCIAFLDKASLLIEDYDSRALVSARDVAGEGAALLTNQNARSYRGFARDRVMIPLIRAFAYLGKGDEEGFRTELFRLREAQNSVAEEYREFFEAEDDEFAAAREENGSTVAETDSYTQVFLAQDNMLGQNVALVHEIAHKGYGNFLNPFAVFISGAGYVRDGDWENAHVDFERLYMAMPDSPFARRYYVAALNCSGRSVPEELADIAVLPADCFNDSLLVVCASGRGPALEQTIINFPLFTAWGTVVFYPHGGKFPTVNAGGEVVPVEAVSDMDGIFAQEYDELFPGIITRIIMSTLIRDAAVVAATVAAGNADALAGLAVGLAGTAYLYATNTADTRSWETLPKLFGVAHCPMPADHRVLIDGNEILLPENCRSAIIYVNTPNTGVLSCNILPFYEK